MVDRDPKAHTNMGEENGRQREGSQSNWVRQLSFGVHSDGPSEIDSEGSQLSQAERDTAIPPVAPL